MRLIIFNLVWISTLVVSSAFAGPRCVCNAFNLTRCDGTGPSVPNNYLWSDEQQASRYFDVTSRYPMANADDCRALSYVAVPREIPVFNYYGYLVHDCLLVWKNCDVR